MKLPEFFKKLPKLPEKKEPEPPRPASMDPERKYWRGSFLQDLVERFKHRGEKIRVDIWETQETLADKEGAYYSRTDCWTQLGTDELHTLGYLPGVRVPGYDSLQWWNQRIYVRLLNWQQFDIHVKDPDTGQYIYSQDTPSTLHDEMISTATKDFMKEMFKKSLPTMDVQKIIMIVVLGIGTVFGLMMMGII